MDDPSESHFNNVCRLCLCGDGNLISAFDENYAFLPQRIASCVNVEIHATDKMSTQICKQCLTKVEQWFDFKKCCEDSQTKIRHWVNCAITKTGTLAITVKEEIDSDDQIQIQDSSVYIKTEPLYLSISEEEDLDSELDNNVHLSPSYNPTAVNPLESLLIPALECPATVHGINGPYYNENGDSGNQNECRICNKEFSSYYNRIRHERNVHSFERETNKHLFAEEERPLELLPDNSSDVSSNVTIEQFAASLQLIQTNPVQNKAISEKTFIEYNRKMSTMIQTSHCDFCQSKFTSSKNLLQHLSKKIKIDRFSCFFCCISFPNRSQFMKHSSKKYCKQRARIVNSGDCTFKVYQHYECSLCKVLYVHKLFLTRHLVTKHLVGNYPKTCKRCGLLFQNADEQREHMQGPCYYKIYCSICKVTYDTMSDFDLHTHIHDDNDSSIDVYLKPEAYNTTARPNQINGAIANTVINPVTQFRKTHPAATISCPLCFRRYSSYESLLRHLKVNHKKYKLFKCKQCTRRFVCEDDMRRHVEETHEQNAIDQNAFEPDVNSHEQIETTGNTANNYSCVQCGDLFPTLDKWCEHQKLHSTNNIHQCSECNRVFGTKDELDEHRSTHPNIKLKLYRCSNSNSYKAVSDYSSTPIPSRPRCVTCNKNFPTNKQLKLHNAWHRRQLNCKVEKTEMHSCNLCDKTYQCNSSLLKHQRLHHGLVAKKVKRTCHVCKRTMASSKALWYHKKRIHGPDNEVNDDDEEEEDIDVEDIKKEKNDERPEEIDVKPTRASLLGAHVCDICNKSFPTPKGLSIHAKLHTHREHLTKGEQPKCQVCNEDFLNVEALLDHMKSHSTKILKNIFHVETQVTEKNGFECPVCNKILMNKAGLASHIKIHGRNTAFTELGADASKSFKCHQCNLNLASSVSLANHMRIHNNAGAITGYACTVCKKKSANLIALRVHYRRVHNITGRSLVNKLNNTKPVISSDSGAERFFCKHCPRSFTRENLLVNHMKTIHSDKVSKTHKCPKCSKLLPSAAGLARHLRQQHTRLECLECNKCFDTDAGLNSHRGWHNRKLLPPNPIQNAEQLEEFKCIACDAQFENKTQYGKHLQTHTEAFKCKFCGRKFMYMKALRKHINFIHGPEFPRIRPIGKKTMVNKLTGTKTVAVKKRKRMRSVEIKAEVIDGPYKCTECHTGFLNAKSLRAHVLTHPINM